MTDPLPAIATEPSIYEYLRARIDPVGRLEPSDQSLPDDHRIDEDGLRWAPGARDGALGHHTSGARGAERAAEIAQLLVSASQRPSTRRLRKLYSAVSADDVLGLVDPMIEKLAELGPSRAAVHRVARWLATTAPDRGAVKIGIALLGVTGLNSDPSDLAIVRTLGAHEEFTLYAAVALGNGLADPESELWALASAVDGWGRIHCVERLRGTKDPAIRSWILRQGYRNSIMYEYLAYIAATTGDLLGALQDPEADREVLTAAGEILEALVLGGPAESLDDYEAGADAVEAYLTQMDSRAESLGDFHAITAVRGFLAEEDGWQRRGERGWTATRREAFEARCDAILAREHWDDRIAVGLRSADRVEFWRAEQAARARGVDTFELHVHRIRADPNDGSWFHAWAQADRDRAAKLVALARELLPVESLATGPAEELGLGPAWAPHSALAWTLQALRAYEGIGGDLIMIGLQSPVVRNRNTALAALQSWARPAWPDGAEALVESLTATDPSEPARKFAAAVLSGEPPD